MNTLNRISSIAIAAVMLTTAALANAQTTEIKRTQMVFAPVSVGYYDEIKFCIGDASVFSESITDGTSNTIMALADISVYDSTDTTKALPIKLDPMRLSRGKGECTSISGRDLNPGVALRSNIFILNLYMESTTVYEPLASGQLISPNSTSGVALLIPIVQAAREE